MNPFNENTGKLITADEAAYMLQSYMVDHNIDPANPNQNVVYGHCFGLNKLKDLITEIDAYNGTAAVDKQIKGVRVYKCNNSMDDVEYEDVFVIPILSAAEDLYPVRTKQVIVQTTPNIF